MSDLRWRHAELDAVVEWLMEQGWRCEKIIICEEEDEPFRAEITLSFQPPSALDGAL